MSDIRDRLEELLPPIDPGQRQMTPSAIGQFIHYEQCHRFLRLDLYRSRKDTRDQAFAAVNAEFEQVAPLASRVGTAWEGLVIQRLRDQGWPVHEADNQPGERRKHLQLWLESARPGDSFLVAQMLLTGQMDGWAFSDCKPDLVLIQKASRGPLDLTIIDMKSARDVTLDHRIQVGIYALLLRQLAPDAIIREAVLYRPPLEAREEWTHDQTRDREAAERLLRIGDTALLSISPDPDRVHGLIQRTVLASDSLANHIASNAFSDLPYHLSGKCDACPHNQFCIATSRQAGDLSLIPYLSDRNKRQLQRYGVRSVEGAATLDDPASALAQELRTVPGLAPRLTEIAARARAYLAWQSGQRVNPWLSESAFSSLPAVSAAVHPNLIQVFLDLQSDPAQGRVAVLGALVCCVRDGDEERARVETVVRVSPEPVVTDEQEAAFVAGWIRDVLLSIRTNLTADANNALSAPIHLYVWDSSQASLLAGLANRQHQSVFGIEALMSLLMQKASFDSPSFSVIADEIEHQRALPMLCQSLQSVSRWLGYRWPPEIIETFRTRQFDSLTVERGDEFEFLTPARSRFRSDVPGEYLHVAWGIEPPPGDDQRTAAWHFYGRSTLELLDLYQRHRLQALRHVTRTLRTNHQSVKTDFDLSVLSRLKLRPESALEAIREFILLERHVEFDEWRKTRSMKPDRRVLAGESLLARYLDSSQSVDVRQQVQTARSVHERRQAYTNEQFRALPPSERKSLTWSLDDTEITLRMQPEDLPLSPPDVLRNTRIRVGDHVIVGPAYARANIEAEAESIPTSARSLLYQARGKVTGIRSDGTISIALRQSRGRPGGFIFSSVHQSPPLDGELLAIEPAPDSWPAFRQWTVVEAIRAGAAHAGFDLIFHPAKAPVPLDEVSAAAQRRFADGLAQFRSIDPEASRYEESKLEYIGQHGLTPITLVQGPPGTGKSSTTGFAVLARLQAALASDTELRVAVACKTHSATDVLLRSVAKAQRRLREIHGRHPDFFHQWFDERILGVPLFRFEPREGELMPPNIRVLEQKSNESKLAEACRFQHVIVAGTTNGLGKLANKAWKDRNPPWDLIIVDEASQMSVPEYLTASLGLKPGGRLIVVGDHRQMPPIVRQNWDEDASEAVDPHGIYRSLFDVVRFGQAPYTSIKFAESFRIHRTVARYLRDEIYIQDDIDLTSARTDIFAGQVDGDFERSIIGARTPVVLVVHDEVGSQQRNDLEREIAARLVAAIHRLEERPSVGVVVPHRSQRAELRDHLLTLTGDPDTADSVDTIERFQGGERDVIIVSATESDPAYLRDTASFLLDPRRLTVAISRAERKMVIVASRSVFDFLPSDEQQLADSEIWRHLQERLCTVPLWNGTVLRHNVRVTGAPAESGS